MFGDVEPADVTVPCGVDGRPRYVIGPDDDVVGTATRLQDAVGFDGFDVVAPAFAYDPDEIDVFNQLVDEWLEGGRETSPELRDVLVPVAAAVWNEGTWTDSSDEALERLGPMLDSLGLDAAEQRLLVAPLLERRCSRYGDEAFAMTSEMVLLATMARRGQLLWT